MKKNILMALLSLCYLVANAQKKCNYSGWQDKTLTQQASSAQKNINRVKSDLPEPDDGLPDFHQDANTKQKIATDIKRGEVTMVLIECDAEGKLEGNVYYNGFNGGYLHLELMRADNKPILEIPSVWSVVSTGGSVPFTLEIDKTVLEGTYLHSYYLKISYAATKSVRDDNTFLFELIKKWKKTIPNEKKVVTAFLIPIGEAARITSTALPQPSRTLAVQDAPNLKPPLEPKVSNESEAENPNTNPKGPNLNLRISLLTNIYADIEFKEKRAISTILLQEVFKDQNPFNKTYYYIPQKYVLKWNKTAAKPLAFSLDYGSSQSEDAKVTIQTALSADITDEEVAFAHQLLEKRLGNEDFTLKAWLPQSGLQAELSIKEQLDIPKDKIAILPVSDIRDPIKTTWTLDQVSTDNLLSLLEKGSKIVGNVVFKEGEQRYNVPIELALNDKWTFGRFDLDKQNWQMSNALHQNQLPFPIKLHHLHAMVAQNGNHYIYSWKVEGEPVVPEGSKIKLNRYMIPTFPNGTLTRLWLDYSIDPCKPCFDELIADISNGTAESRRKFIRFQSYYNDFFKEHRVQKLIVTVKSAAADPRNQLSKSIPLEIKPENATQEMRIGPFYTTNSNLNYQYRYTLVTHETNYESDWMTSSGFDLFLQKNSFKQAFPTLPNNAQK